METIGSYRILSQIGAGGMGAVFLAEHRFLKRRSAIKMLLADLASRPDVLERFFAEARATSQLEHPGIVRIFDCEIDSQGRPYFVMEYLEGETLGAHLRRLGRLPASEAAGYAIALCDALGAAHDRGIVHRDLKPDNIFVRPGPVPGIKLVDFGIAKLAEEYRAVAGARTQTGTLLGTPPYMSPEQCRGASGVDHRTDIYSLACVLFEMLCGVPPFERDSTGGFLIAHITQVPPTAHEVNPQVPMGLSQLIARMLAKAPEERPQTMQQVAAELRSFAPAPVPAPTPPPRTPVSVPIVQTPEARAATTGAGTPRTTLQSNAGELIQKDPAAQQLLAADSDLDAPPPPNRRFLGVGAVVALGIAGFTAWKTLPPRADQEAPRASTTAEPRASDPPRSAAAPVARPAAERKTGREGAHGTRKPAETPPAAAPTARTTPRPKPPAAPAPTTPPLAPNAGAAAAVASGKGVGSASAKARGFVIIDIDSEPTGALLCFEGDPRIISATRRAIQLPYADQDVTFLVDLPGYVPGRLIVRGNRDARKVVKLQPMPAGQGRRPSCSY